jgi:tetratricopeptide (TPR) repeat protein
MLAKSIILTLFISLSCIVVVTFSWANDNTKASQFYNHGLKALEQEEYEMAISDLEKALVYAPDNKKTISALSLAYNNYGVMLSHQPEQTEKAIFNLERAVQLSPQNIDYRHNLSQSYSYQARVIYEQKRNYDQAIKISQKALEYNSDNFLALEILGDCYYFTQNLKQALDYWQKALRFKPESKSLKERIEKVKREIGMEPNLKQSAADYFDIRLTRENLPFEASLVRDYLRQAYREVGQDFNYFPKYTIVVLIYTDEEFRRYSPAPYWSGGAYDGKIHLPANAKNFSPHQLQSLIWHEYTHVLVRDLSQGRCPVWLNEGLAVWEGGRYNPMPMPELNQALKNGQIIPLLELDKKFAADQRQLLSLAYQEAYTTVSFLIQRYGFWHIQKLLAKIKNQEEMSEILKDVFGLSWDSLEKKWQEYLKTLNLI